MVNLNQNISRMLHGEALQQSIYETNELLIPKKTHSPMCPCCMSPKSKKSLDGKILNVGHASLHIT
jgi:hypothetical protein